MRRFAAQAVPALEREAAVLGRHDQLGPGVASPGPGLRQARAIESWRRTAASWEAEAMWNELGVQYPFSLLCAYPAQPAACAHQLDDLTEVCRAHTQVIGAPPEAV